MGLEKNIPPFWGENKLPWPEIESLVDGYKRNIELMNVTQQIAIEATKSVIQLQMHYMKHIFDQLSEQAKYDRSPSATEERIANQSDIGKATVDKAIEHATKINSILSKSNEKIIENIQKHFKEGFDETVVAAKKTKAENRKTRSK